MRLIKDRGHLKYWLAVQYPASHEESPQQPYHALLKNQLVGIEQGNPVLIYQSDGTAVTQATLGVGSVILLETPPSLRNGPLFLVATARRHNRPGATGFSQAVAQVGGVTIGNSALYAALALVVMIGSGTVGLVVL